MKRRQLLISLVAIGLFGIWAAPQFERARGRAVRHSCQNNLRQIGLAISQYSRDYDEKYPLPRRWRLVLQPYILGFSGQKQIEKLDILDCPLNNTGYSYNFYLGSVPYARLHSTATKTPMVFDSSDLSAQHYKVKTGARDDFRGIIWTYGDFPPQKPDYGGSWPADFRHPEGNNVLFVDGHVGLRRQKPVFSVK